MRKLVKLTAVAGVAMATLSVPVRAAVFDVTADFSVASNPNGVWTYGYSSTLGGAFNLYDAHFVASSWNKSGEPFLGDYGGGLVAVFHPGDNGEYSIYRFTAPASGNYNLNVVFSDADSATTDVHVRLNNSSLFVGAITDNSSTSHVANLVLVANDILDFAVGFGSNGNYFNDSTSVDATLTTRDGNSTAVPEPVTLSLLGAGLIGLRLMRRSRAA